MKKYTIALIFFVGFLSASGQNVEEILQKETLKTWDLVMTFSEIEIIEYFPTNFHDGDMIYALKAESSDSLAGYAYLTSALGRYELFDYFILYDLELVIKSVKVWKYRSTNGGAITGKRWLKQFIGYKGGLLKYGKDIQALSGATISGNSIVDDVQRAQTIIVQLREKGLL